jgi:antirestriction protein ArdC
VQHSGTAEITEYYLPGPDMIQLPPPEAFRDAESTRLPSRTREKNGFTYTFVSKTAPI